MGHDRIAREAGVAVGTVYRRFPDKGALVAALFTEQVDQVALAARAALRVEDPWQAIADFLLATVAMQVGNRGLRDLNAGHAHGSELAQYARAQIAPIVEELVARGHARGVLRAGVAEQDLALVPVMVGAVIKATPDGDPDTWRRALAIALAGLREGGRPPLPGGTPTSDQIARLMQGNDPGGADEPGAD